jgi:hypothetical protein
VKGDVAVKLQVDVEGREWYLWVAARGTWKLADVLELIDLVGAEAHTQGLMRVVVDIRQVEGDPPEMDRFRAGEHAASVLGSRIRTAVIGRAESINRFAEGVAVQSGADMRVFSNEDEALEWVGEDEVDEDA